MGNESVRERERETAVKESGRGRSVIKKEIEMSTRLNYERIAGVMQEVWLRKKKPRLKEKHIEVWEGFMQRGS